MGHRGRGNHTARGRDPVVALTTSAVREELLVDELEHRVAVPRRAEDEDLLPRVLVDEVLHDRPHGTEEHRGVDDEEARDALGVVVLVDGRNELGVVHDLAAAGTKVRQINNKRAALRPSLAQLHLHELHRRNVPPAERLDAELLDRRGGCDLTAVSGALDVEKVALLVVPVPADGVRRSELFGGEVCEDRRLGLLDPRDVLGNHFLDELLIALPRDAELHETLLREVWVFGLELRDDLCDDLEAQELRLDELTRAGLRHAKHPRRAVLAVGAGRRDELGHVELNAAEVAVDAVDAELAVPADDADLAG
eukprot:PhM_4_TR4137/c0_g10_i1/m.69902